MYRLFFLSVAAAGALAACSKPTNGDRPPDSAAATNTASATGAATAPDAAQASGDVAPNNNGLPVYPHLNKADLLQRDVYKGGIYSAYKQDTSDSLETVEAYYRKAWPGAQEGPTDSPSDYVGIKLTKGQDFIEIYRFGMMKTVSIDAMKYVGPAPAE